MASYRRNYVPGATYFFTVVTGNRQPFLTHELARDHLRKAIAEVRRERPFSLDAIVLLPDHLHAIWTLPPGNADFSTRWKQIKTQFTRAYLSSGGPSLRSYSRVSKQQRTVWQPRFWEHTCINEDDVKRCLDYLHYNPVKHGLAAKVSEYRWSSFERYVELGEYDCNWGALKPLCWSPPDEWD